MSIKTEIKRLEHYQVTKRSALTRYGALALSALTVFGMLELGHDHQQARREAIVTMRASLASAAENETVRMPIKFDDGLRAPGIAGE